MKKYKKYNSIISIFAIIAMIAMNFGLISNVEAAYITSMKDTHSTIKQSIAADHIITFNLSASNTFVAGDQIDVDFAGYTTSGTWALGDFTFSDGTGRTVNTIFQAAGNSTVTTCNAGANSVGVAVDTTNMVFRVEACSGYTAQSAGALVTFTILGTSGNGILTNPATGTYAYTITAAGDTATIGKVAIIDDDVVAVTATVDPTLTFAISDVAIGFGTLSSAAARWASADANGSASDVSAHNLIVATNAATGYLITYNGATLTNGSHTIDVAALTNSAAGSINTEQFGMGFSTVGSGTVAAAYDHNATDTSRDWAFVAGATTTVVSKATPAASETISAFYLANIADTTQPGSYSTAITYIATGIF